MKTTSLVLLTLTVSALILHPSNLRAQGGLTPPGAPAPLFKTLDQLEPRTPISSAPFTITNGGSYYLTTNVSVPGGVAISINADAVTLDLKGFTITGSNPSGGGFGILIGSGRRNVTILNGFIQGSVTNNGGGYSGPGFLQGISNSGNPQNVRVSGVNVSGCFAWGINLARGSSTVVDHCHVRTVGNTGISAGTVTDSVVEDAGGTGITAVTANNCTGSGTTFMGLTAENASNCKGVSISGIGLNATNAINCSGSSSNSIGLNAITAQSCTGSSANGTGLSAYTANNCYGSSATGHGLLAERAATTCVGITGGAGSIALHCSGTANGCTGQNAGGGTAVKAVIGIGCVRYGGTNDITSPFLGTLSP